MGEQELESQGVFEVPELPEGVSVREIYRDFFKWLWEATKTWFEDTSADGDGGLDFALHRDRSSWDPLQSSGAGSAGASARPFLPEVANVGLPEQSHECVTKTKFT